MDFYKDIPRYATIESKEHDFFITWVEDLGLIDERGNSSEEIESFLSSMLDASGGRVIRVTPEGPFLSGLETDGASVAWAINTLYGSEPIITGDLPTMKDLGLDPESNFNEDGSPRIR